MDNQNIMIDENSTDIQIVGKIKKEIIDLAGANISEMEVQMFPGFVKHLKKRHPNMIPYLSEIPGIIENPDYVGVNPTEPNSIELIKKLNDEILLAIKLDPSGYLFLSSMYDLTPGKVPKRLNSGRIKEYKP